MTILYQLNIIYDMTIYKDFDNSLFDSIKNNKLNKKREKIKYSKYLKLTDSSTYIRPLFGSKYNYYENTNYINCHILNDKIYLVFLKSNSNSQKNFLENFIQKNKNFEELLENSLFFINCMKLPDDCLKDLENFKKSKFSKISNKNKDIILKFHKPYNYETNKKLIDNYNIIKESLFVTPSSIYNLSKYLEVDLSIIKNIGEIKSKIDLELELFNSSIYSENGILFNYFKNSVNK